MKKPKIAIVRGPGLSKWEMQIYEPLVDAFNITGIGSTEGINDISNITFPVTSLPLEWSIFRKFPKYTETMYAIFGDTQWLDGFNKTIQGFDLLHTVELRNGYTLQAVQAKGRGLVKAVTATVYENIPYLGDEYPRREKIKSAVIPHIDHFMAANEAARQALLAEGVDERKVSIIPQSVDTSRFTPSQKLRKNFGIQNDDFVVLGVGRMVWEKGWYDIVRSAHLISNINPPAVGQISNRKKIRFLLVGDGLELKSLRQMVERLGLSQIVKFTGNIPYRDMPDVFRLADVFVLASLPTRAWNEQFGGVLIEAMSAGLPIVGTLNGGIKETVGETGGIFVPPQSFSEIARSILSLYKDPKQRKKMGDRNRVRAVELYDTQVVALKIKDIWANVLV